MRTTAEKAVFLSYAREDVDATRRIAEALRGLGVEVWFDQNDLRGGDAWDQEIRRQIHDCALFVPIISAHTQNRKEGYFRREWKQAVERLEDIAEGVPFLVPVCVDDTPERSALVPRAFLQVQWSRLPHGEAPDAFVRRVAQLVEGNEGAQAPPPPSRKSPGGAPAGFKRATRRIPVWAWAAVMAIVAIAGAGAWKWLGPTATGSPAPLRPPAGRQSPATPAPPPAAAVKPPADLATPSPAKSVAVLAFVNLSEDKENEHFSDGISEELANVLAKIPDLRVSARASAFHFKGTNTPISEIAAKLNVAYVVEGSVQRVGSRVKISAQLNHARDGFRMWSDTFTRELKDIFAVQDEIAGLIAQNLQLRLSETQRATKTVNPEAHRAVLEGRHFWNLRTDFARADAAFSRAIELDPQFAEAHASLADNWASRGWYRLLAGETSVSDEFTRAKASIRRAQELLLNLAGPYATLGAVLYNERRFAESEEQFQRAFALNRNYAWAHHWHGHLLTTRGRPDLSLAALERALALDPLSTISLAIYSFHLYEAGRFADALAAIAKSLVLRPEGFIPLHAIHALILSALGRTEAAVAAARYVIRHPDLQPRWWGDAQAIHVLRVAGLRAEAAAHAELIFGRLSADNILRGFVLAALDRHSEAVPYLERTISSGIPRFFYWPMWDPVRSDPRLPQLLEKMNCVEEYQLARATLARMKAELGLKE